MSYAYEVENAIGALVDNAKSVWLRIVRRGRQVERMRVKEKQGIVGGGFGCGTMQLESNPTSPGWGV